MKISKILLILIGAFGSLYAQANPISVDDIVMGVEYQLGSHPDGGARPPLYGLRLDGLTTGNTNDIYTYDFDHAQSDMRMIWNAGGSLNIFGQTFGGLNAGDGYASPEVWEIDFTYNAIVACSTLNVALTGLCAGPGPGAGDGWISSTEGTFDLTAVAGRHPFSFRIDDNHRGVPDASGWGWLNHCRSAEYTVGTLPGASCREHVYSSDWLFTVHSIPEPGTLALLGIGLLGMGLARRRKTV